MMHVHLPRLFLLGIERKEVRDLLLEVLPLSLQAADFLGHDQDLPSQLLLELLDVDCGGCISMGRRWTG